MASSGTKRPGGTVTFSHHEYDFIEPSVNYCGRPFSDWAAEYTNWLINPQSEGHYPGEVIFLNTIYSRETHEEITPSSISLKDTPPIVKVGDDALQLTVGNAVFFPSVLALAESTDGGLPDDETARRGAARGLIKGCTLIISRATFDDKPLPKIESYVESSEFMLNVPDFSSGNNSGAKCFSLRTPGKRPCVAAGNFHMVRFNKPGRYALHLPADVVNEARGVCYSNGLLELNISQNARETSRRIFLDKTLDKKTKEGKISKGDYTRLSQITKK